MDSSPEVSQKSPAIRELERNLIFNDFLLVNLGEYLKYQGERKRREHEVNLLCAFLSGSHT